MFREPCPWFPFFWACHGQNTAQREKECARPLLQGQREQSSCSQVFQGQQAGPVDVDHISHGLSGGLRAPTGKDWVKGLLPEWLDNECLAGRPAPPSRCQTVFIPRALRQGSFLLCGLRTTSEGL